MEVTQPLKRSLKIPKRVTGKNLVYIYILHIILYQAIYSTIDIYIYIPCKICQLNPLTHIVLHCVSEGLTKALTQAFAKATVDIYLFYLFIFGDISMNLNDNDPH